MKLYAARSHVAALHEAIIQIPKPQPKLWLELAWHTRQDEPQAVEQLLLQVERSNLAHAAGRVALVQAEQAWLAGQLDKASEYLQQARLEFGQQGDAAGLGDVALLRSRLAQDQGLPQERQQALADARGHYEQAGDAYRQLACDLWSAVDDAFTGSSAALATVTAQVHAHYPDDSALNGLAHYARGLLLALDTHYLQARPVFDEGARLLLDAGLVRYVIACYINAGGGMGTLGDSGVHMVYVEQALALARPRKWPQSMGSALYTLTDVCYALGQLDAARAMAREARHWMAGFNRSRAYVAVVALLADICMQLGFLEEAQQEFEAARVAAEEGGHQALLPRLLAGMADCLSRRGHAQEALALAYSVVDMPTTHEQNGRYLALMALAHIHTQHPGLPLPAGSSEPTAALHFLAEVWREGSAAEGWQADDDLLQTYALAWEQIQQPTRALYYERLRITALNRENTQRAARQVATTTARHEAETAQREAAYQRQLLSTERRKLGILESLSLIGQEITAAPELQAIFETLSRHAGQMLDVSGLRVWLLQDDVLVPTYSVENGVQSPGPRVQLSDVAANSARAARERQELLVEFAPGEADPRHIPGTAPMSTLLFAPLLVGSRLLGVISIQSERPYAYGEVERLVFRNIAAYSAVALGNALNYRMLSVSHDELMQTQEELERHASQDPLTGLHNRRYLLRCAARHIERLNRNRQPMSLLMIDVDFFKSINDSHGHAAGDLALREAAQVILTCVRPDDLVARFGGEEFVVLLPGAGVQRALEVAERIRLAVARQVIPFEELRLRVTVSIGVADWHSAEPVIDNALRRADQALYQAKAAGRNVVKIATTLAPEA